MIRPGVSLCAVLVVCGAVAEEQIADLRQGTNLSLALTPDGTTLVVDLIGQLWSLPASGGGAIPLTPAGEQARNPRVSPDGTQVVYQRRVDEHWDLWLLDLASGERRALTTSPFDEREPDFTRDGRAVVFAGNRSGHYCLWSIAIDGGVETQLTEEGGSAAYPTVSEHGLVAYLLDRTGEWSLRVLNANGVIDVVHTSARRLSAPSWRPGGGVLAFAEQDSAATSELKMLVLGAPRVLKTLSGSEDIFTARPAWQTGAEFVYAADGQLWRRGIATPSRDPIHLFAAAAVEVATPPASPEALDELAPRTAAGINGVSRSADGRSTTFTALGDVWLAERGEPRRLTDDPFVDLDPSFWPDGESVVFASERTGQFELWRQPLRDGAPTQLTFGALQPRYPVIRPDGKAIAYVESMSLETGALATVKIKELPRGEPTTVARNVVGAASLTWSADGRTLSIRAAAAEPFGGRDIRTELHSGTPSTPAAELPSVRWQPHKPPADYVVEVGRLFDGVRATYHRHVDLHVRDGRIAAIVPRGMLPAIGEVVDARDATIIPGLVDLHAHASSLSGERLGRSWLAYGVTTVRELTTSPAEAIERAEAWASGRLPGPRLFVTSAGDGAAPASDVVLQPNGGIAEGLAHSLSRQARELGVPRLQQATIPSRLLDDVDTPSLELELSPGFMAYQDGFSRLIASETTFVTGLAALAGLNGWPAPRPRADAAYNQLFTPTERVTWERPDRLGSALPGLERTVARLVRAGGRVGVGSDAPAVPYGLGLHLELALLARAGIGNDQVLRMATAGGALALGLEQQIGTLEQGKLADFVVLEGDPLVHINDTLRIVAVAKSGRWFERAELLVTP